MKEKLTPNDDKLYHPCSFFMMRSPILPIEDFFDLFNHQDVHPSLLFSLPERKLKALKEAIAVASPNLYQMLLKKPGNNKTFLSVLKYFARMTCRSTPFGIFAFVTSGGWRDATSAEINTDNLYKRTRPDMEWLECVVDKLSKDVSLFQFFSVRRNPLIVESGGRIFLNFCKNNHSEKKAQEVSIRSSVLTQVIFEISEYDISFSELLDKVILRFPGIIKEKVCELIYNLLEKQFLNSTLMPSLLTESPFDEFISKLTPVPHMNQLYSEIKHKINLYDSIPIGLGEEILSEIKQMMGQIASASNFLQVDTALPQSSISLSKCVQDSLIEAIELNLRISQTNLQESPLASYHQRFLEKYGTFRKVPLLELLHEKGGVGIPEIYLGKHTERRVNGGETKWQNWLTQQLIQALQKDSDEIILHDKELDRILKKLDKNKCLPSLDVYCEIFAESCIEVDRGKFDVLLSGVSWHGGATFGRFVDLLGDQQKSQLQAFYLQEEEVERDLLFVDSSYHSTASRHSNVAIHPKLRRNSIDLGGVGDISLENICVRANSERLYLTFNNNEKEIYVSKSDLLLTDFAPIPMRFMLDVSLSRFHTPQPFSWDHLNSAPYLPRLRYKKIILSPARWVIDNFLLNTDEKEDVETIEKKLKDWILKWKMPRYCLMVDNDQRSLIDFHQQIHLHEISTLIKSGKRVTFFEKIGQKSGHWVKSQEGSHCSEFVFPFVKNPKYSSSVKNQSDSFQNQNKYYSTQERLKHLGSEWLYVKCYLGSSLENRFLMDNVSCFTDKLVKDEIIDKWFFVRYSDTGPHVRLRFHGEKEKIVSHAIPLLHQWINSLVQTRSISEVSFSTYEREIERYGGEELMESAESLFYEDSASTLVLLKLMVKEISFSEEIVAALSLIDFLCKFGLDLKQQIDFFSSLQMPKEQLIGFRESKSILLLYGAAILDGDLSSLSEEGLKISKVFEKRRTAITEYANKIDEAFEKQELLIPQKIIHDSILHMHCNRFFGRNVDKEIKARLYAHQTLNILKMKKTNVCNYTTVHV